MLPPDYLINRAGDIMAMYADLHTAMLESIAQHIAGVLKETGKAGVIPSTVYQIERANAAGLLRDEVVNRVAEINKMSRGEIRKMFEDAAVETLKYDYRVYEAAGLTPIPIEQSPEMLRILDAGISKTLGSVERLTGTIAINAEQHFYEYLGVGYNKVASGAFSYNQAINDTVDRLAREDIRKFHYGSGVAFSIEHAVRMNVLTGINQTACEITHQSLKDMGVSLVRTSAHVGARNEGDVPENHEKWQGKIFKWSELEADIPLSRLVEYKSDYPDFIETTGYMVSARGLAGPNCRHNFGVYIEGLSPEKYSEADLDKLASATVKYADPKTGKEKTVPYYEATQIQRNLERRVRRWDRIVKTKKAAGLDVSLEKKKLKAARLKVMKFTEQTGLKRDYNRERGAQL